MMKMAFGNVARTLSGQLVNGSIITESSLWVFMAAYENIISLITGWTAHTEKYKSQSPDV